MRIGVFAYNFPHKKTQEGLINLFLNNIKVDCIFAADPVTLNFYQSKIRISPKGLDCTHPKRVADRLNIPYFVLPHYGSNIEGVIRKRNLELGIVLGARIIKEPIIKAFNIGILNMHPGLLPENRGLDNIKWAILKNYKQGVSCHLINKNIDMGKLLFKKEIDVFSDDTLIDIYLRIHTLEQSMMISCVKSLQSGFRKFEELPEGNYFPSVPLEEEKKLMQRFEQYKRYYGVL